MINSLTVAQKARFSEFVDKWTKIELSTEPADRPKAEEGIRLIYGAAGLKPPKIVWCTSPLANGLTRAVVQKLGKGGASVRASVRASVWASVRASVWASVRDSVWASVGDSVGDSVWASVRASVGDSGYGQHDAEWLAFYDYFCLVCNLNKETQKLAGYWLTARSANWYLPHEKLCWISDRHNVLRLNKRGRLHCESGMALSYPDGWGIYALNGIRVKPEYVLTPADQISPETVLKEKSVDVRRELLRKVGVLRMSEYGKVVDAQGDYKLIDMAKLFTGLRRAPFLLMKNPSLDDTFHLEGVAPECETVEQAINWRAGNIEIKWSPAQLS
jgi:hypothetical protein